MNPPHATMFDRVLDADRPSRVSGASTSETDPRPTHVLVADPDPGNRSDVRAILVGEGFEVVTVDEGRAALRALASREFDVVALSLHLPGLSGLGVLAALPSLHTHVGVLLMASAPPVDSVVEAMKLGARDVLPTSPDRELLLRAVESAAQDARGRREFASCHGRSGPRCACGMVGDSPSLVRVLRLVDRVGPTRASVLITGETGTGKELVADAVHRASDRASRPLITVNCAALPPTLLEAELFGHVKGSFTGAIRSRVGLIEEADGGTLFLDEIGSVSLDTQVKLLRVLEERRLQRVGANVTTAVDFRLVAATNEDLSDLVQRGAFREDLYFRLHVFPIHVPPLRERIEDLPLLAHHFLEVYSDRYGLETPPISSAALARMREYSWPGNVRELENVIERGVIMQSIEEALHAELSGDAHDHAAIDTLALAMEEEWPLERLEREYIVGVLERHQWSKTAAADALGVSRRTVHRKLERYSREGHLRRMPH
jgi:DNA-binding NtrC family response regulator